MHTSGLRGMGIITLFAVLCIQTACSAQTPQITVDLTQPSGDVIGLGHNLTYYPMGAGFWDATNHEIKASVIGPLRDAGTLGGTSGRTFIRFPAGNENEDTAWRMRNGDRHIFGPDRITVSSWGGPWDAEPGPD
jgi:hypothetical protein